MLWGIFSLFLRRAAQSAGLCALVFFPCGEAAAYVALGLVYIQEPARLSIQRRVDVRQTLGQILMFRRDELERFRPSPNLQANAGKYPHSHPYPLRFSG